MAIEEGTITKIKGEKAWVMVRRSTMCESCRSACHSLGGGRDMECEAINSAEGEIGDRVLLKISTKSLWKILIMFYLFPVIALISGALIGMKLSKTLGIESQLSALIIGAIFCALSFLIIMIISDRLKKNREYMPEITKIISSDK